MSANMKKRKSKLVALACPMAMLLVLLLAPYQLIRAEQTTVDFRLKPVEGDPTAVDVALSFNLDKGEKAVLKPTSTEFWRAAGLTEPVVELTSTTGPSYQIEGSATSTQEWILTALVTGEMNVDYRVVFLDLNRPRDDVEAPGGVGAPGAMSLGGLRVYRGSDVLLCPRMQDSLKPLSDQFQVEISAPKGQKVLAPWQATGEGGSSFKVSGEDELLDNYVAWGTLDLVTIREKDPQIVAGFSGDYAQQSASERSAYVKSLSRLYDNLAGSLGARPHLNKLSVVLVGVKPLGLDSPTYGTLLGSTVICHGGKELSGDGAAAAAGGLFQLWNEYSLVPASGGEAGWFQAGLPHFYPMRVAALAGLMDSGAAYQDFSQIYRAYLQDPQSSTTSLVEAEGNPGSPRLLALKGAAVCASLSMKLQDQSKGSAHDIDWLLGRMAEKFDHFKGKDYALYDISEIVENATGESWDRYFQERVRGTKAILSSEFSESGLFGSAGFGRSVVVGGGSGRSWLYLLIAILVILLIPVIFSTYVRRSVKLDLTMPKIIPDDDFEE
jgi:hypothetical protein